MPLITGAYLFPAILSCLMPIGLLICFATFFVRQTRKLPPNASTSASAPAQANATATAQAPADVQRPYSDL